MQPANRSSLDTPPSSSTKPGGEVTLEISGDHFIQESIVSFNNVDLPTTFVTPTQLKVRLPASLLSEPGVCGVTVFNPPPGGGASRVAILTIQDALEPLVRT